MASISAYIYGNPVQPQFVGAADGLIAGITRINIQVPVAAYSSNTVAVSINNALGQIYVGQ
jgi:uncharacterized protein (TIGR03437 family)